RFVLYRRSPSPPRPTLFPYTTLFRSDEKSAVVRIRLIRSAEGIAREGSRFWIVRPRVGFGQITGLGTVLSGPEVQVIPGKPDARSEERRVGDEERYRSSVGQCAKKQW